MITDFAIDVRAGSRSWMSSGFVFEEVNVGSRIAVGTGVDRTYLHAVHRAPAKRGPYLRPAATSPRPTTWTDYRSPSTENAPRAAASRQPPLSAEAVTPQSCHRPTSRPNPRPSACQRDRGPKISLLNRHFRAFKHSVSSRRVNDPGSLAKVIWCVPLVQARHHAGRSVSDSITLLAVRLWAVGQGMVREWSSVLTTWTPAATAGIWGYSAHIRLQRP